MGTAGCVETNCGCFFSVKFMAGRFNSVKKFSALNRCDPTCHLQLGAVLEVNIQPNVLHRMAWKIEINFIEKQVRNSDGQWLLSF